MFYIDPKIAVGTIISTASGRLVLVRRAIELGKCRVDLLRGDEPYKYEWGAIDEPIQRILVRRTESLA